MKYFWFALIGIAVGALGVLFISHPQLLNLSSVVETCQKLFTALPLPHAGPPILCLMILVLVILMVGAIVALSLWAKKLQRINKAQEESIYELHSQIAELLKIREPKKPL